MKKKLLAVSSILLVLIIPAVALADNLRVTPEGGAHTGMAIITGNPALLEAYATTGKTIEKVWFIIIIDEATYADLSQITISLTDFPTTLSKSDFSDPVSSGKIPKADGTDPYKGPNSYPGCTTPQTQYQVEAIRDQMGQVHTKPNSVRYVLVYGFDQVDDVPSNGAFTVTIDAPYINVLVLAQGINGEETLLNQNSPFSGSTLIIPELSTVLTALASFAALALYIRKYRKISNAV